jgi:RNA polymerase sigma factor (sigma-70 family)
MVSNDELIAMLDSKDYNSVLASCEKIIYHYLHRTNFWNIFVSERDDLVQEGRLAIYKCALTYDKRNKFTTYVHSAVRNALYNYVKRVKLFDNINVVEIDKEVYNNIDDTPLTELYENVMNELLNSQHSDILHSYFVDEYTQNDIAIQKGLSQQWVGTIINNFRRDMNDKYGIKL